MAEEVTDTQTSEPTLELTPEEQSALQKVRGETEDYVDKNFNPDGTPKNDFEMPEKFQGKTAEEIAKAYVELEKLKAKQLEEEKTKEEVSKDEVTDETDTSTEDDKTNEEVNKVLTPKDFEKYEQSFIENGGLTEADYKELEKKGLSKELVDTYIESVKIKGEVYTSKIYEVAGGEEAYSKMIEWAREHYNETQASRFDSDIKSGNIELAKEAIETLKLRMGTPPTRLEGETAGMGGLKPFNTRTEYFEAVRNPAYKTDRRYAQMVDMRYFKGRQQGLY